MKWLVKDDDQVMYNPSYVIKIWRARDGLSLIALLANGEMVTLSMARDENHLRDLFWDTFDKVNTCSQ